jgi:hypothetical protein
MGATPRRWSIPGRPDVARRGLLLSQHRLAAPAASRRHVDETMMDLDVTKHLRVNMSPSPRSTRFVGDTFSVAVIAVIATWCAVTL